MYRIILFSFLLLVFFTTSNIADETSIFDVEAAFVFKFIKFVTWPDEEEKNIDKIDLCYMGKGGVKNSLDKLEGLEVKNRKIRVRTNIRADEIKSCRIVFIDINIISERKRYLRQLNSESILTISHFDGFIDEGGMINMLLIENKVNFEINFISIQKSNLKVSAKLLNLAKRIIADNRAK